MKIENVLAAAAASGLLAGVAGCGDKGEAAKPSAEPTSTAAAVASAKHDCKGKNDCKGQGGCKLEGKHECKTKNDCKGQGGCKGT